MLFRIFDCSTNKIENGALRNLFMFSRILRTAYYKTALSAASKKNFFYHSNGRNIHLLKQSTTTIALVLAQFITFFTFFSWYHDSILSCKIPIAPKSTVTINYSLFFLFSLVLCLILAVYAICFFHTPLLLFFFI